MEVAKLLLYMRAQRGVGLLLCVVDRGADVTDVVINGQLDVQVVLLNLIKGPACIAANGLDVSECPDHLDGGRVEALGVVVEFGDHACKPCLVQQRLVNQLLETMR